MSSLEARVLSQSIRGPAQKSADAFETYKRSDVGRKLQFVVEYFRNIPKG